MTRSYRFDMRYVLCQVLQLQSATTSPQSQPVDYDAGIEAMVLAILQQTSYSQQVQRAELGSLSLLTTQANTVADGQLLAAYSDYLEDALAANTNLTAVVQSDLLNDTAVSSLLPVSTLPDTACCLTSMSSVLQRNRGYSE